MLQFPLPSQVGVLNVPSEHIATPQTVPGSWNPFRAHRGPEEQDILPALQGFDMGQGSPSVHETQLPELQTRFVPQSVPSDALLPVSWQVMFPVAQLYTPVWQGLLGVQLPVGVQDMH